MWLVWTGGNDRFWDGMTGDDLRRLRSPEDISSHPEPEIQPRTIAWQYLGLVNEPCFEQATGPDPTASACGSTSAAAGLPAPIRSRTRRNIPGVKIGARGTDRCRSALLRQGDRHRRTAAVPQSRFRRGGARRLGSGALLHRPSYYNDKTWCGRIASACPAASAMSARARSQPPADPENPAWANLNSNRRRAVFLGRPASSSGSRTTKRTSSSSCSTPTRPGALDTSLVSTDNINNPRTMNAVYNLGARLEGASAGRGEARRRRAQQQAVQRFRSTTAADRAVPAARHGLDAARAEGRLRLGRRARRAQPRLSEHRPVQRGMAAAFHAAGRRQADHADPDRRRRRRIRPTGRRPRHGTPDMALFFLKAARAGPPAGRAGRAGPSSPRPGRARPRQDGVRRNLRALPFEQGAEPAKGIDARRLRRLRLPAVLQATMGLDEDRRLQGADARDGAGARLPRRQLPVDRAARPGHAARTNACSPLATNAIRGNIWDNFSSQTYKELPSVGKITVHDPFTGDADAVRDAGRRARLYARPLAGQRCGRRRRSC